MTSTYSGYHAFFWRREPLKSYSDISWQCWKILAGKFSRNWFSEQTDFGLIGKNNLKCAPLIQLGNKSKKKFKVELQKHLLHAREFSDILSLCGKQNSVVVIPGYISRNQNLNQKKFTFFDKLICNQTLSLVLQVNFTLSLSIDTQKKAERNLFSDLVKQSNFRKL